MSACIKVGVVGHLGGLHGADQNANIVKQELITQYMAREILVHHVPKTPTTMKSASLHASLARQALAHRERDLLDCMHARAAQPL
jgi:hypothetical protein